MGAVKVEGSYHMIQQSELTVVVVSCKEVHDDVALRDQRLCSFLHAVVILEQ